MCNRGLLADDLYDPRRNVTEDDERKHAIWDLSSMLYLLGENRFKRKSILIRCRIPGSMPGDDVESTSETAKKTLTAISIKVCKTSVYWFESNRLH